MPNVFAVSSPRLRRILGIDEARTPRRSVALIHSNTDGMFNDTSTFEINATGTTRQTVENLQVHIDEGFQGFAFQSQPNCGLLNLPAELRIQIWSYMDLSPDTPDCNLWKGAYFACRQMHCEIREKLKPEQDIVNIKARTVPNWIHESYFTLQPVFSKFGDLSEATLKVPVSHLKCKCPGDVFGSLYGLHLRHLTIILTGTGTRNLGQFGDLKTLNESFFAKYAKRGLINCKKVTFSIEILVNRDGGRAKATKLDNVFQESGIPYTLVIVQDEEDRQVERSYSSPTRYQPQDVSQLGRV